MSTHDKLFREFNSRKFNAEELRFLLEKFDVYSTSSSKKKELAEALADTLLGETVPTSPRRRNYRRSESREVSYPHPIFKATVANAEPLAFSYQKNPKVFNLLQNQSIDLVRDIDQQRIHKDNERVSYQVPFEGTQRSVNLHATYTGSRVNGQNEYIIYLDSTDLPVVLDPVPVSQPGITLGKQRQALFRATRSKTDDLINFNPSENADAYQKLRYLAESAVLDVENGDAKVDTDYYRAGVVIDGVTHRISERIEKSGAKVGGQDEYVFYLLSADPVIELKGVSAGAEVKPSPTVSAPRTVVTPTLQQAPPVLGNQPIAVFKATSLTASPLLNLDPKKNASALNVLRLQSMYLADIIDNGKFSNNMPMQFSLIVDGVDTKVLMRAQKTGSKVGGKNEYTVYLDKATPLIDIKA